MMHPGKLTLFLTIALSSGVGAGAANGEKRRAATPPTPAATEATAPISPASSFDAFRLIVDRNIFNPNRASRTRAAPEEKPPRVDEIALVGTMNYAKGLVAFFESADASFKKTVSPGDVIAGFKVERISSDGVDLTREGSALTLKVSHQLRRVEGSDWAVNVPAAPDRPGLRSPASVAPAEVPADASDVLKRLLKKRDKQLN